MQKMLDIINLSENVELKTFDVGRKPHPATFAVVSTPEGTRLMRGTEDITDLQSFWDVTGETNKAQRAFRKQHFLEHSYQPRIPPDIRFSHATPIRKCYDGRMDLEESQFTSNTYISI